MENNNATISINLQEGSIVITGSEEFVAKNMEAAFDFVGKHLSPASVETFPADTSPVVPVVEEAAKSETVKDGSVPSIDRFVEAGVYHIDAEDGTISILKKVPGSSKAEKAKNIALIVLYVKKEKVFGKELISLCEKHACYDSANFSSTFKNEMTYMIRKGSGQNWTIELTQPGEEAALNLLEEMANGKK